MHHADFVHLHNHTQYSLLDGACKVNDLLALAKGYKLPALAITDHGNMFGAIEFYRKAIQAGIKPILGMEAYVAPHDLHQKEQIKGIPDTGYHLVLLVKNLAGYKNLIKLATIGYLEGFYFRPRIDKKVLKEHSEGLIAFSSCLSGEIPVNLLDNREKEAEEIARQFLDIFGEGSFFIELQDHDLDEERKAKALLVSLSKKLNIPLVATNDCHYLKKEHAQAHDALLCIQTGKSITDTDRLKFGTDQVYFKSPDEMKALFSEYPSAIENTLRIAEECNLQLEFGKLHLPHFPLPSGFGNLDEYLEFQGKRGLAKRYSHVTPGMEERLGYELSVIKQMGFAGYFLIVKDFIDYARLHDIPVGPGRGSAAGSLVAYALGITNIDPIKYGLIFERFLNPERISMPDIDIDFSDKGRDRIIEYVINRYGKENVAQIITFGSMAARAVVRDVGRVMDMAYSEVDRIAKMIPAEVDMTLHKALEVQPELKKLVDNNPNISKLISYSQVLEGLSRHASTHAAGVVIAPSKLIDFVPLYKSNKDEVTTQYDMTGIEDIGLLKIDFLGLRTLTVIDDALARLNRSKNMDLSIEQIPLDDLKVYQLFAKGETVGVFQFESPGMREYLKKLKPETLDDLTAMNALYRPGPLDAHMVDEYIDRKRGFKEIKYEHPSLEPILKETYGVIVYQEQVIKIASETAGYTLSRADILRKAMGKKIAELMKKQRDDFIKGAKSRGISKETAEKIFDQIDTFGRYGFNKSHSLAYALVAYQTAYLKTHYPLEFMAATLTSELGDTDRIVVLLEECKRMGIEVLHPDLNDSFADFQVTGNKLRFGLAAIKNVGLSAVESIVTAREKSGKFTSIFDFCSRVDLRLVNRKSQESLIVAGAFDSVNSNRAVLVSGLDLALQYGQAKQKEKAGGQTSLFAGSVHKDSSASPSLPEVSAWDLYDTLSKEKEILGFYLSGHPLSDYKLELQKLCTHNTESVTDIPDNRDVTMGGIIVATKANVDRKGKQMAFATLEDFTGRVELIIFSDVYERCRPLVKSDSLVLVKGTSSTREGEKPKIIVQDISGLGEAWKTAGGNLHLQLSSRDLDSDAITRLKEILKSYPGQTRVILHVDGLEDKLSLKLKDAEVAPNPVLYRDLTLLLGEENVRFEVTRKNGFKRSSG
ncbi:MAG: DNA polymerase III subunit alpha [candidate division Zixibacteria bacterium RBG_16_50_21]|nr:MAG: DNA polymerase III subunit alpha [candidate division Zixibacteria bacterium RBG_16_50_21]